MKRYKQLIVSNVNGDCVRTCLACLLGRKPRSIPNFTQLALDEKARLGKECRVDMWDCLLTWCQAEGFAVLRVTAEVGGYFKGLDLHMLDGALCMVSVPSQRYKGGSHAVVGQVQSDGTVARVELVHDVSPSNPPYPWFAQPTQLLFLLPRVKHLPSVRQETL